MIVGALVGRKSFAHLHTKCGFPIADGVIGERPFHLGVTLPGPGVLHMVDVLF